MDCRPGCGACCVVPSISSLNKPAFVRCPHLDGQNLCRLFGHSARPAVCSSLRPEPQMCGANRDEAYQLLTDLERRTAPE